jgi:NAD(P)-dependent dehydrogenase (short-subunit alcohol dehydrogenase family)
MTRKVLVTAGGAGIGKAIAKAFLADGASVYACDIDPAALERTGAELAGLKTGLCDVADRAQVEAMVAEAADALGGIDVLVNCAGISGPTAPVQDIDPDDWERVLGVHLTGTFNVTRLAIPHLIRSPAGVVINMSSAAGRFGYPNRSPYATVKWGLIGFTKTLAMELGEHGVRVNAILPGGVEGERVQRVLEGRARVAGQSVEEVKTGMLVNQSIKRLVDPDEIGALAVFLASDAAKSISGQMLNIDGDQQRA